jgi:hypothetical protein
MKRVISGRVPTSEIFLFVLPGTDQPPFKSFLGLTTAFGFVTWARNLGSAHAGALPAVGADLRAARRDETNHAVFFSLLMGLSPKNGRLGDPALPSLGSNSFHVKQFHPKSLRSPPPALRQAPSE